MKIYSIILGLVCCALPTMAYQAGPTNRANFGASAQQPAEQQQAGYRSFSNYNNRFGQGVQTSTVQTSVAGSSVKDFSEGKQEKVVGKQAAASAATSKNSGGKPAPNANAQPQAPASPAAQMPANADPAAMLQQVQGMMQSMNALTGGAPAQGAQNAAAAPAAMPNIPGMPDMSALMGGAAPAATPAAPAKK